MINRIGLVVVLVVGLILVVGAATGNISFSIAASKAAPLPAGWGVLATLVYISAIVIVCATVAKWIVRIIRRSGTGQKPK